MAQGRNSDEDSMPGCRNSTDAQRLILVPVDQAHRKAIMSSFTLPVVNTAAPLGCPNTICNLMLSLRYLLSVLPLRGPVHAAKQVCVIPASFSLQTSP